MKLLRALVLSLPFLAAPILHAGDTQACGGCLIAQSESTQVSSHRMILSISQQQTTLWDQITYAGEPSSFAWVLPIKGQVEIGLSSDALFATLDSETQVQIVSPTINCPPVNCDFDNGGGGMGGAGGAGGGGGVVVIAEEVVGPYATVQLKSSDPNALTNWLTMNGYNIPADVAPVIDAYVQEGFDFLALKLVPGQGINSMRPVRVTSPGASLSLPLRMVAAGTGVTTPISLWVMGEGRYEPKNFPRFEIGEADLVWNWDTQSSNYKQLRQNAFDASEGKTWLIEAAEPFPQWNLEGPLLYTAESFPEESGYGGDPAGPTAKEECQADLDKLYGTIPGSLWVTRMYAELARPALAADLVVGAAAQQKAVQRYFQTTQSVGTPPACPEPPPWCTSGNGGAGGAAGGGEGGAGAGAGAGAGGSAGNGDSDSGGGCAVGGASSLPGALTLLGGAALMTALRRRRRR